MRSRTAVIIALLAASFLTTAFIAGRALVGATYHRTTAERTLRDYAALAADQFVRASDAQIAYYGCYPLVQKIAVGAPVPISPLVRRTYSIAANGSGGDAPPALEAAVRDAVKKQLPVVRLGDTTYYVGVPDRASHASQIGILELNRQRFPFFFDKVLHSRGLLPRSLAGGKLSNRAVYVRVFDGNSMLFQSAGRFDPALSVRRELGSDDGVMTGLVVEASINRAVAPLLVFGGLPRSTLPTYGVMLLINFLLIVTAVMQVQRERALARLRSDFISGVSHELRTPLTQIRMFIETVLLDRVRSAEERQRSLQIVDQESRRLGHLVENVLQFSRGERGQLKISAEPHDLGALARATVDAFAPIARARGTSIDVDEATSIVRIDEDAMRQVLINLLDNAVKYGPPNQRIIVSVHGRELAVEDEGPGVPEKDRNRIFERYRRLDRDQNRAIAGMGIGLSVVRELVALHGGKVRVESGTRGGARFVVAL